MSDPDIVIPLAGSSGVHAEGVKRVDIVLSDAQAKRLVNALMDSLAGADFRIRLEGGSDV